MFIFSIISIFGLAKQCAISHILRAISHMFPTHQQTKTRKRTGHIRSTFQRLTLLSNEVYRIVRPAKAALGDQQKPFLVTSESRSSEQERPFFRAGEAAPPSRKSLRWSGLSNVLLSI